MRRGLLVLLAGALIGCTDPGADGAPEVRTSSRTSPIPMVLHGMPLVGVTAGAEADVAVTRLHGREVGTLESYVGRYRGGGAEATLYVSRVADDPEADSLVLRMSRSIGAGSQAFAHHTTFRAGDVVVHAALGQGQEHFFWARGTAVTWLSIDRGMARPALSGLLDIDMELLPAPVVAGGIDLLPPPDSLYRRQWPEIVPSGGRR